MKKLITSLALCLFAFSSLSAQNNVVFDAADNWGGYMNVFNIGGWYEFGSQWGILDLKSTTDVASNTLTLQPNFGTYNASDPYWVDANTLQGIKMMEAITFVEPGATYNNVDLTFSGDVISNTIDSSYKVYYFIKALDPNNGYLDALNGSKIFELPASGSFSVSATAAELPAGLVIQYGFYVFGLNANPTDEAALGNVTIGLINTSTNQIEDDNRISVNPNPVTNQLSINSDEEVVSYNIFNLSGQLVLSGRNEDIIDVSHLNSGMYLLSAQFEDTIKVTRFVKK